ncbi:MAG: hypothetical protein PHE15_04965 [Dehalococcoidales bacterium]|nr:hypothetical protein [Dehalococcoidales bacterium]
MKTEKYTFKPGDIVKYKESENGIGPWVILGTMEAVAKFKIQKRKFRAEVVKVIAYKFDKDGDPCIQLRRLDTKAHGLETWSQGFIVLDEVKS